MDAAGNVIFERQPLYCVPIPGEAEWAKEISLLLCCV